MSEYILGIDTSARVSVGLADGDKVLVSRVVGDTRSHVELLAQTVAEVVAEAGVTLSDVGRIGVGVGPGPFTGLRVGIATALVLGEALDVPVTGVCSLDAVGLAADAFGGEFVVVTDARRHEVYWARYDASGLRVAGPFVSSPNDLPGLPAVEVAMDAGFLAANLDRLPDVGLEPIYLRQPDADLPSTRKSVITAGRLDLPVSPIGGPR